MNIHVQVFYGHKFLFHLGVEFLNHTEFVDSILSKHLQNCVFFKVSLTEVDTSQV